jgi:hypothetical protein
MPINASFLDRASVRLCIGRSDGEVTESGASGERDLSSALAHDTSCRYSTEVVYVCEISVFNIATGGYPIVYNFVTVLPYSST